MSEPADAPDADSRQARSGRKRLLLIVAPLGLIGIGAGLWFSGILSGVLGHAAPPAAAAPAPGAPAEQARPVPTFIDMPEILANLNAPGRRPTYIKLRSKIEVARAEDVAAVQAAMPRLVDLFQTYLREMRPEELRGSAGTHRLREELMARANIAAAPARISDVLFVEILVQ
ncbi:flagellar basal body-associated FliL family protein [Plastoroseomonas arctica]|uniref:Flagellar protein FliL n=1 Tax=Plastoroseomonas arctica TaxID=1509237 RepID=A0AAF1K7B2_9PROT|nr:flagellar basal body-associated FliL family protein [Plastoroseomonas arctica]MBR0657575.1 flagellar basal body protein FliL [Plastoroseomonas arctica]